jgi:hypothetical protein
MLGHSIVSQHFMEPEGPIPNSQELSTSSYPEPDQSSPSLKINLLSGKCYTKSCTGLTGSYERSNEPPVSKVFNFLLASQQRLSTL